MVDKTKNPVAKYARKFNKAVVMTDRKKAAKKGDRKHKGQYEEASVDESLTTAQKEKQLASLRLKQANQRVQMTKKHQREKEILANESIEEASAPSTIRFKGKKYYSTGKQGKDMKTGAPSFEYSSDMDGDDERVFYNTKTRKITRESVANESTAAYAKAQSNIRRKNKAASMTSSDKNKMGKLSALMKKQKREEVEEGYLGAQGEKGRDHSNAGTFSKSDAYSHAKKHNGVVHKDPSGKYLVKHGRGKHVSEEVEQVDEATSKKLLDKMKELGGGQLPRSSVELRKLKAKAQDELRGAAAAKKAAPVQKTTSKTSKGKTQTGSADPADRNLIMQLRKAQDALSPNTFDIIVSPTGRTVNLPKKQIDALLKKHDSLGKPVDKRKFKIMLTKALRAKAK